MMQSVPRTFSPSSFKMTRSTPWVDGCCGPMFRTSSLASRKDCVAMRSMPAFDTYVFLNPAVVHLGNAIVFPQRMSVPIFGHQNSAKVGMVFEFNPEHIET